jgi:hypothetical protein
MTAAALTIGLGWAVLIFAGSAGLTELYRRLSPRVRLPIRRHCWICRERLAGPWYDRYCPSSHRHIERLFR